MLVLYPLLWVLLCMCVLLFNLFVLSLFVLLVLILVCNAVRCGVDDGVVDVVIAGGVGVVGDAVVIVSYVVDVDRVVDWHERGWCCLCCCWLCC